MKPLSQPRSNKPTEYHCYDSCNKCCGVNEFEVTDFVDGHIMECKTKCKDCGFEDYWAHGFFESGQEIESKCQKYSFGLK